MNKKGISPLIATVLIIGLTIALAAIIMNWGTGLFQRITVDTERQLQEQQKCTSELDFQISTIDCTNNKIEIDNRGTVEIRELRIRVYNATETLVVDMNSTNSNNALPLAPAYIKRITMPTGILNANVNKLDIIATISGISGGKNIQCGKFPKTYNNPCAT